MFSPSPGRRTGWFVVVGSLHDGEKVDLYRHVILGEHDAPLSWERPARLAERYRGTRWRKYMMNIRKRKNEEYRPLLAKYLAREWKREHGDDRKLKKVEIYFCGERLTAYEPNRVYKPRRIWKYTVRDRRRS